MYVFLQLEMASLIYSLLCLLAGIVGLVMFIRSRDLFYGWFSLYDISMALALLFNCRSLQWFIDFKSMYYWDKLIFPLVVFACVGMYRRALGDWRWRIPGGACLCSTICTQRPAIGTIAHRREYTARDE